MRYRLLLPMIFLVLAGCVVSTPTPAPTSTTYVTPATTSTTYAAPGSTTTVIRTP
jgi:hypothetical protein